MMHHPPTGARDLLPLDVIQKRWLEGRLRETFEQWGYHPIITSTFERLDALVAGGSVKPLTLIQVQDAQDGMLALRPELTASIARAVATRMAELSYPQRLYYHANVFRRSQPGEHTRQQEFFQAGVELIGSGGAIADAEILLLLANCMQNLGFDSNTSEGARAWTLLLGEASLTRSLLADFHNIEAGHNLHTTVQQAIADLDRVTLETLDLPASLQDRALLLFDLRGHPQDVLQKVMSLPLTPEQQVIVERLQSLITLLADPKMGLALPLVLDLSLVQTFDYYTGIVFKVVSCGEGGQQILGEGGRYDRLLEQYHPQRRTCPGIGFALNIEDLQQVLLPQGTLPEAIPASDWLVVPKTPDAYPAACQEAQNLRQQTDPHRVELYLGDHPDQARDYARSLGIASIAWCVPQGPPHLEQVL